MATNMSNIKFKTTILVLIMLILIIPQNVLANQDNKIMLGDINNDKTINSSDLLLLLRHVYATENNKHREWILTGDKLLAGDITQNGKINSSDIITILRYFAATENREIGKKYSNWLNLENYRISKNPEKIILDKTQLELSVKDTATIKVIILPEDATDKDVTWTTSNDKVVTVRNGTVTAKSEGKATITAKTSNGKTATCTVRVKSSEIIAKSININKNSIQLEVGKSERLTATIDPENVTNNSITWTTSNTKVATVNNGTVTAKGEGQATITAKTSNGKTATCIVRVKALEINATSIKLNKISIQLETGESREIIATISPENTTNKSITWTTSNDKVAIVNNGTVTAKGEGEATITARTTNGKIASCKVVVGRMTSGGKVMLKNYNVIDTSIPVFIGHKYTSLTQTQKKQIAYLAYLEQGSLEGAKIELSLMANLTEESRSDYDIYSYVMYSGWFGPANCGEIPDNPQYDYDFTSEYYDAVERVLVKGERYLPSNVDEHDCESDISYISTGSVYDRNDYIPGKTVIHNCYGSVYTFIGFAPNGGDPFGYTN